MNERYVMVTWPEIQDFMDHPRYKECYMCESLDENNSAISTYMVPESLYEEVMYKLQFPKKYENTSIGTVICYETHAIVNGNDTYWYDPDLIKKESKVLVYNHDTKDFCISTIKLCSQGFPIVLEDDKLIVDINCEIIGTHE